MGAPHGPIEHLGVLRRRLAHLDRLHREHTSNSWDEAERSALRWVLGGMIGIDDDLVARPVGTRPGGDHG